jgi:hypothetical protein
MAFSPRQKSRVLAPQRCITCQIVIFRHIGILSQAKKINHLRDNVICGDDGALIVSIQRVCVMNRCRTEIDIKNVLLATDFSEESVLAVPCARRVRELNKAKLHVVHMMDLFPFALSDAPEAIGNVEQIRRKAEEQMRAFAIANQWPVQGRL